MDTFTNGDRIYPDIHNFRDPTEVSKHKGKVVSCSAVNYKMDEKFSKGPLSTKTSLTKPYVVVKTLK